MLGEENVVDEAEVAAADRGDVSVFLVLSTGPIGEDAFEHRFSATTLVEPESTTRWQEAGSPRDWRDVSSGSPAMPTKHPNPLDGTLSHDLYETCLSPRVIQGGWE
jgi:hypothetical protein